MSCHKKRAVLVFRFVGLLAVSLLLFACGGGGGASAGSSSSGPPGASPTISGSIGIPGVSSANVTLSTAAADGTLTKIGTATSAADGSYSFTVTPSSGALIVVDALGGSYADPVTKTATALDVHLRATTSWNGTPLNVNATALSEAATRYVASQGTWIASVAATANANVAGAFGIGNILNFTPVNLFAIQNWPTISASDLTASLYAASLATLPHRMPAPGANQPLLAAPEDVVYTLAITDPQSDYAEPYLVLALYDAIADSTMPSTAQFALESGVVTLNTAAPNATEIDPDLPVPNSTGSVKVAPDPKALTVFSDPFLEGTDVVTPDAYTLGFDQRGALIGYSSTSLNGADGTIDFSASVADLYGDADVNIGRWNGGLQFYVTGVGTSTPSYTNPQYQPASSGWVYFAARPATSMPTCGTLQMPLVAATNSGAELNSSFGPYSAFALQAGSTVRVQYLPSGVLLGADLVVAFPDGSTAHFASSGGAAYPAYSTINLAPSGAGFGFSLVSSTSSQTGLGATATATLAGLGGTKFVMKLRVLGSAGLGDVAAVFDAGSNTVDTTACNFNVGTWPGISPLPTSGTNYININLPSTVPATPDAFGPQGQIQEAAITSSGPILSVGASTPVVALAGNAYGAIGVIDGPYTDAGQTYATSALPYAITTGITTALPTTGQRTYTLLYATPAFLNTGGSAPVNLSVAALESISAASATVYYGQDPSGNAISGNGTIALNVQGTAAGSTIAYIAPANYLIVSGAGPNPPPGATGGFSSNNAGLISGSLCGPNGNYLVVVYNIPSPSGYGSLTGALWMQGQ